MARTHFLGLNYTCTNEDTLLEYSILPKKVNHILCVASSGARVVPLLAKAPKRLTCIDYSREQIYLTQLRIECLKQLQYDEYIEFFGYRNTRHSYLLRKKILKKLTGLSVESRDFFSNLFDQLNWEDFLFQGTWERNVVASSVNMKRFFPQFCSGLFECKDLTEQRDFVDRYLPKVPWKLYLYSYTQYMEMVRYLRPKKFPRKETGFRFSMLYEESFKKLFYHKFAKDNLLLQLSFLGRLKYQEAWPLECNSEVFRLAKDAAFEVQFEYKLGDVLDCVRDLSSLVDYFSLSNIVSYFEKTKADHLLQKLKPKINKNGLVIVRRCLNSSNGINLKGFRVISEQYQEHIEGEKTCFYEIDVYQRREQ